jgi:hypothetical protein
MDGCTSPRFKFAEPSLVPGRITHRSVSVVMLGSERGTMKRIPIAILFGLVAGAICASGAFYGHILKFSTVTLVWILLNRAVMGFAIGASGLRLHWAWNGVVMGLVVGSIFSYFMFMTLGAGPLPLVNFFVNGLFGLMIEFFTTVVFKQPSPARAK